MRAALDQLGWHASAKDVAALLANFGTDVDEGMVRKVKVESIKGSSGVRNQEALAKRRQQRRKMPLAKKAPTQRTYRR